MNLFILLNPVGLFRTIVVFAIVYFAVRLFSRHILPFIVENKMKEMQKKMRGQEDYRKRTGKQEGDVTIEYRKNNNNNNRDVGEYVDFEEVD
jgi:IS30 family transposase